MRRAVVLLGLSCGLVATDAAARGIVGVERVQLAEGDRFEAAFDGVAWWTRRSGGRLFVLRHQRGGRPVVVARVDLPDAADEGASTFLPSDLPGGDPTPLLDAWAAALPADVAAERPEAWAEVRAFGTRCAERVARGEATAHVQVATLFSGFAAARNHGLVATTTTATLVCDPDIGSPEDVSEVVSTFRVVGGSEEPQTFQVWGAPLWDAPAIRVAEEGNRVMVWALLAERSSPSALHADRLGVERLGTGVRRPIVMPECAREEKRRPPNCRFAISAEGVDGLALDRSVLTWRRWSLDGEAGEHAIAKRPGPPAPGSLAVASGGPGRVVVLHADRVAVLGTGGWVMEPVSFEGGVEGPLPSLGDPTHAGFRVGETGEVLLLELDTGVWDPVGLPDICGRAQDRHTWKAAVLLDAGAIGLAQCEDYALWVALGP